MWRIWVIVAAAGSVAAADVYTETFDEGVNAGGWQYGGPGGGIGMTGGNPGAFWSELGLDTFAPQLRTTQSGSPFTGDFRSRNVTRIGVDLLTQRVDFSAAGRPLTLMLTSRNGTDDPLDDGAVYFMGANIPLVGEGWKSYDFSVPSQASGLPAGWAYQELGPNAPPTANWAAMLADVSEVRFFYGDPTQFFIFQMWDLGADNMRIETVPGPGGALVLGAAGLLAGRRRR